MTKAPVKTTKNTDGTYTVTCAGVAYVVECTSKVNRAWRMTPAINGDVAVMGFLHAKQIIARHHAA